MNKRIMRKQFVATLDFDVQEIPLSRHYFRDMRRFKQEFRPKYPNVNGNIRWRLRLRLIGRELAHLTPVFKPGEFPDEVTALEFCGSSKRYYFNTAGELVRIEKGGTK